MMEKKVLKTEDKTVHESEVLSYNMGGYIYKVAYRQIDLLADYSNAGNITNWFRTAKSLWRKVKAGLVLSVKEEKFVESTDKIIKSITDELNGVSGQATSRTEQTKQKTCKRDLIKDLEDFEQNIFMGMTKIKMWIPTSTDYDSPEAEFSKNF